MSETPVASAPTMDSRTAWKRAVLASIGYSLEFVGAIYMLLGGLSGLVMLVFGGDVLWQLLVTVVAVAAFFIGARMLRRNIRRFDMAVFTAVIVLTVGLLGLTPLVSAMSGRSSIQDAASEIISGAGLWVFVWFVVGVWVMKIAIAQPKKKPATASAAPKVESAVEAIPQAAPPAPVTPYAELSDRNKRLRVLGKVATILGWVSIGLAATVMFFGTMFSVAAGSMLMFGNPNGSSLHETADAMDSFVTFLMAGIVFLIVGVVLKGQSNKPQQ